VADYYYEINDLIADMFDGKYFVVHNRFGDAMMAAGSNINITLAADRIWKEHNGEVLYIKNRTVPNNTPVDLQEFMWVKLSSKVIN
jgi:recombinational DNA repair protein RecR